MHVRRSSVFALIAALIAAAFAGCNDSSSSKTTLPATRSAQSDGAQGGVVVLRGPGTPSNLPVLTVTSTDFTNNGPLPRSSAFVGCSAGQNISPQISWTAGPPGTQSYVLTMFDPDAPTGVGFWHWTVANIPASVTSFATGAGTHITNAIEAYTDYGRSGYGGPCPPPGDIVHHYIFTVSALNIATIPGVTAASTGTFITFSIRGTIVAQGTLVGTFSL
jgi:Raf kinase inhibitor-like YbhB/YbcL family protein